MKVLKYLFLMALLLIAIVVLINMKEGVQEQAFTIAFYNVENLFDTEDDPHIDDNDFLPTGKLVWTQNRYKKKISNLSEVIDQLGDKDGPEILGLAEVENEKVIKDLVHNEALKSKAYKYIHYDSPDRRGIDVALVYKSSVFKPFFQKAFEVRKKADNYFRTRSILLVGGIIGQDSLYIYVNHWPSRRGGASQTKDHRFAAAHKLKSLVDSLNLKHKNPKVIIMGDFNDDPSDQTISKVLQAGNDSECKGEKLFDPFCKLEQAGDGSLKFKHEWNNFDQIILSGNLIHATHHFYVKKSAHVFHPIWMHYKENNSNGPYRTYQGLKYYGGYSDHFPVYVHLSDQ